MTEAYLLVQSVDFHLCVLGIFTDWMFKGASSVELRLMFRGSNNDNQKLLSSLDHFKVHAE